MNGILVCSAKIGTDVAARLTIDGRLRADEPGAAAGRWKQEPGELGQFGNPIGRTNARIRGSFRSNWYTSVHW